MNRSASETQSQMSNEEGLQPILAWIKRLCDAILIQLGAPNLEFAWRNETVVDPTVQRENLVALVNAGMMTRRRAAQIMGEILPDDPMADVLAITTGQGVAKLQQNWSANDEKKVFTQEVFAGALDKYSDAQELLPLKKITLDEARTWALIHLSQSELGTEFILIPGKAREYPFGWVFFDAFKKNWKTDELVDENPRSVLLAVDFDGSVHPLATSGSPDAAIADHLQSWRERQKLRMSSENTEGRGAPTKP